ncbi:MAG: GNAT family N-acetyltransferase [Clostridiaceae bacterium]|nr:GNAT family N-acetyltransferase [Clostridiaceae bacterium]
MNQEEALTFHPLKEEDIEPLTRIMKRAFDEDTRIHLDRESGGPPGYDNGEFLRKWGLHPHSTAFRIQSGDRTVGAVIVWINRKTGVNQLGNVFVDPDSQNLGMGMRIWTAVEAMFPDTRVWQTETPGFSRRNHHFYVNKCGFHVIRIENPKDPEERSFILEKRM